LEDKLAYAAMGNLQPPSIFEIKDLSALIEILEGACSILWRNSTSCVSVFLQTNARAPCPAAGKNFLGSNLSLMYCSFPNRFNPASARIIASYSPFKAFSILVSIFPLNGMTLKSFRKEIICIALRKLLVPIIEPLGSSFNLFLLLLISTSFTDSLWGIDAMTKSLWIVAGTSLTLWIAKSTSPLTTDSFISFSKIPFLSK
jgi:hypothetical protein